MKSLKHDYRFVIGIIINIKKIVLDFIMTCH